MMRSMSAILDLTNSLNAAMHLISSFPVRSSLTESVHPEAIVLEDGLQCRPAKSSRVCKRDETRGVRLQKE